MTDLELIFTMLGEASTTEITIQQDAQGFRENKEAAQAGGKIAGNARKELEAKDHKRYYMKKTLGGPEDKLNQRKITRTGVYGVVVDEGKLLVVRQKRGPYTGKLDFPGGGIEFGESAAQAMRREFAEEVAMEFDSMQLIDNLTATVDVPSTPFNEPYLFYQIGMIYQVNGCRSTNEPRLQELEHIWIDPQTLSKYQCSSLLWEYKQTYINGLRNE